MALVALMDQHAKDQVELVSNQLVREQIRRNGLAPYTTDMGAKITSDIQKAEEELGLTREGAIEYLRRQVIG